MQDNTYFGWVWMPASSRPEPNGRSVTISPSQPKEPLMLPSNPEFPFQQTDIYFFNLHGRNYVTYTDWYTG